MWLAGAVGLACGLGLWSIAVLGAPLALVVLGLLGTLQHKLGEDADEPEDRDPEERRDR